MTFYGAGCESSKPCLIIDSIFPLECPGINSDITLTNP